MPSPQETTPPHDTEAEKCLIGSLSLNDQLDMVKPVVERIRKVYFYVETHQQVFVCIRELIAEGQPTDIITVGHRMKRHGWWEYPETPAMLCDVIQSVPHAYHVEYYADIVVECWRRRRMIELADWLYRRAADFSDDVDDTWSRVGREVGRQVELRKETE